MAANTFNARLIIAERCDIVRRGLIDIFSREGSCTILGETDWPPDLSKMYADLLPDIAVVGVPARGDPFREVALDALRDARACNGNAQFLVVVEGDTAGEIRKIVQAGAAGILARYSSEEVLVAGVRDVVSGDGTLDPSLARTLFRDLARERGGGRETRSAGSSSALSPKKREVLRALTSGFRGKELAQQLGVTVGTVKTHIRHILRKLDVPDRASALLKAHQEHLLDVA